MLEIISPIAGIIFGAVGCWILVRRYVRELKKEWQSRWDEEAEKKAQAQLKAYAAERDFNHLKNHLGQLQHTIELMQDDLEEVGKNLVEMRSNYNGMFHQLSHLAARLDASTSGWVARPSREQP